MKADLTRYNICNKDGNTHEEIDDYGDYVDAETIIGNLEKIQDLLE